MATIAAHESPVAPTSSGPVAPVVETGSTAPTSSGPVAPVVEASSTVPAALVSSSAPLPANAPHYNPGAAAQDFMFEAKQVIDDIIDAIAAAAEELSNSVYPFCHKPEEAENSRIISELIQKSVTRNLVERLCRSALATETRGLELVKEFAKTMSAGSRFSGTLEVNHAYWLRMLYEIRKHVEKFWLSDKFDATTDANEDEYAVLWNTYYNLLNARTNRQTVRESRQNFSMSVSCNQNLYQLNHLSQPIRFGFPGTPGLVPVIVVDRFITQLLRSYSHIIKLMNSRVFVHFENHSNFPTFTSRDSISQVDSAFFHRVVTTDFYMEERDAFLVKFGYSVPEKKEEEDEAEKEEDETEKEEDETEVPTVNSQSTDNADQPVTVEGVVMTDADKIHSTEEATTVASEEKKDDEATPADAE